MPPSPTRRSRVPNRNYNRGRAAEYAACAWFKAHGWKYATRAAGSHGIADVIAWGHLRRRPVLCQVKSGGARMSQDAMNELQDADWRMLRCVFQNGEVEWL